MVEKGTTNSDGAGGPGASGTDRWTCFYQMAVGAGGGGNNGWFAGGGPSGYYWNQLLDNGGGNGGDDTHHLAANQDHLDWSRWRWWWLVCTRTIRNKVVMVDLVLL